MRNGQNKRMRGRNRKGQNPLTRVYESNGPDVKIRGTANHVADKYVQLARDAQSSGDPVGAENYYQHAEHYFRLIAAVQEQFRQSQPFYRDGAENRDGGYDDSDEDAIETGSGEPYAPREQQPQPYQQREQQQQSYPPRERFQRDRDHHRDRDHNRDRDRGDRGDRGDRDQPQSNQMRQPPAGESEEAGDVDRLPAFLTGGSAAPAQPNHQNGANGANGQNFEGNSGSNPDRFPLHRRRRRRHGGRDAGPSGGDAGERSGE